MRYHELARDKTVRPIIAKLLGFIANGVTEKGAVQYQCDGSIRHVTYHAAVVAAALSRAGPLGFDGYDRLAERVFANVLSQQRPDGGFFYSTGDYRLLNDRRSYPRYLAMIMYHLLHPDMKLTSASR
jgi:hypothetical protein